MRLYTAKEVASLLHVAPVTVIRLVDDGVLSAIELVRRKRKRILRFTPEIIDKFLASRTRGPKRSA